MEERLALRGHAASISLRGPEGVEGTAALLGALRSSVIGCWLGITPGGAIAASFMGYNLAKRFSRQGRLRQGPDRGRVRAGQPRMPGTAVLPMLALGFPARTAAILLGGLMVWGLNRPAAVRRAQGPCGA
jgi:TctA family transporter